MSRPLERLDPPVAEGTRRFSAFLVWMFASVGFVAAIVQILSFFSNGGSQLRVRITPHSGVIQGRVLSNIRDSEAHKGFVTSIAEDQSGFYCEAFKKTTNSDKAYNLLKSQCDRAEGFKAILRLLRDYDGSTKYFDYQIENIGSSTAKAIKLSNKDVFDVDISRAGDYDEQINRKENENFYRLPDLNPGEKISLRAWSSDFRMDPDDTWLSASDFPAITYEGGKSHVVLNRVTPAFYSDLHDWLSTFPLPITILILLFLCTVIGVLILVFFAIVEALVRGKPLAEVFKQPSSSSNGALGRGRARSGTRS